MNTFEPRAMIRFGWETFKKRPWFFIGVFIIICVLSNLSIETKEGGPADMQGIYMLGMVLAGLILAVMSTLAQMGGASFTLKAAESPEGVRLSAIWAPKPFWRFVGTMILKNLVVGGPIAAAVLLGTLSYFAGMTSLVILAVVLGIPALVWAIYMGVRLSFTEFIVMDQGLMPVDALKASYRMTDGKFGLLVRFYILAVGVMLLGLLALVVGLVVAIPVCALAFANAYRTLRPASAA